MSQTGSRFFRNSFISYVHYRENGKITPIRVDGTGVGQYDASTGSIEAEDYFKASGITKIETREGGFIVADVEDGDFLTFPNIKGLGKKSSIEFRVSALQRTAIEIHQGSPGGDIIASYKLKKSGAQTSSAAYTFDFPPQKGTTSLSFVFRGRKDKLLNFDSFSFH